MDTAWLEVFRTTAQTRSFTAAAKELGYTQSAISRQISALESEMRATLFDRLPRGVHLTEEGRYLLRHAVAILEQLDSAKQDVAALRNLAAGRVRIGSFATAGVRLVPAVLVEFASSYPDVTVSHHDGLTAQLTAQVATGELDIAVVNGYPDQIASIENVALHHLMDEPIFVALPQDHPLVDNGPVRLEQLANEKWIAGNASPHETLIRATLRQGFFPKVAYVVQEWMAKQGFVAAGLGITMVPALGMDSLRPDIALVELHPDDTPIRGIFAATSLDNQESAATAAMRTTLRLISEEFIRSLRSSLWEKRKH